MPTPATLRAMRPHQWVKNVFVLAPLVFAEKLLDPVSLGQALLATGTFCMLASAVYLRNDVLDIEGDRKHPVKRFRPIAAGELSIERANRLALIFALGAFALAAGINGGLALTLGLYLVNNLIYSMRIKRLPYLDVTSIALGFLLRVVAGGFAIEVQLSQWLVLCTFLLALFLALGKRHHELASSGENAEGQRGVLARYSLQGIENAMMFAGLSTVAAYTAYAVSDHAAELFGAGRMRWTVPLTLMGIARFLSLTREVDDPRSPTERILRDPLFLAIVLGWCLTILGLVYVVAL